MPSTALQIVQAAQGELGLIPLATTVQAATDDTSIQMLALLNWVGADVAQRKDWTLLATAGTVAVIAATSTYALPADFRNFVNRTEWDQTNHWELLGPTSPQEWQLLTSGVVTTGPRRHFRQVGRTSQIQVWPTPGASDSPATLGYIYVSNYWASSAAGTAQAGLVLDSDTAVFPDRVMIAGLKARFFQVKGFDAGTLTNDYERQVRAAMAWDGGAKTLRINRRRTPGLLTSGNVPDGNFPAV